MKEKIMNFFKSEKLKNATKKVFNRKTIVTAVIIVVVAAGLKIGYSLMFEVNGVVSKIDGSKVTLVTKLSTQTVDVGNSAVDVSQISVGERIEIVKNLSGQVIYVKDESLRGNNRLEGRDGIRNMKDMRNGKGNRQLQQGTQKSDTTQNNNTGSAAVSGASQHNSATQAN